jgi:uncharacterized repeat protein (TIGR01451 family)
MSAALAATLRLLVSLWIMEPIHPSGPSADHRPRFEMEFTPAPAAPRRLVRRLIPWTLSLGLFAGGGYGVYTYAVPKGESEAAADAAAVAEDASLVKPSATANEQIKQLFASSPAPSSQPSYSYSDRYAAAPAQEVSLPPQLPPTAHDLQAANDEGVDTPRSAASLSPAPTQNPFATVPVAGYADRYGAPAPVPSTNEPAAATVQPPAAASAPAAVEQQAVQTADASPEPTPAVPIEVTRGQEPASENPLRSGSRSAPASENSDARPAFGNNSATISQPSSAAGGSADAQSRYEPSAAAQAFAAQAPPTPTPADGYADASASAEPTPAPAQANPFASATPLSNARQQAPSFSTQVEAPMPAPLHSAAADAAITPTPGIAAIDGAGRPGERILEGIQNPAIAIQKLAPAEIQVGKKCTFAVRVQNSSKQAAHNVQVRDEVPFGTQLVGTAPKATVAGSQVTWDLGTLSPGEERIVEMELMPTEEGELGSVATVTFAAQASAKVRSTRPQLALRLTAGPRVMIGDQHVVQIEVANPGSGDATGVMLLETVPAGVSHEAGPALEFEVGTLRAGETKTLDLVLTAEQAGRISNAMTVRADAGLEVEAVCEFEVIAPDLKVSVDGPKQRYLERPATYTVSIDNPGTAAAKEVQLITQLPKGLQFVSANNMGEYDAATHSVHWSLPELPANERGVVELVALPVETGEHTLQVASRAEQGLEDRTEAKVNVEGLVALSFEVSAVAGAIEVGGDTAYDITVVNQGTKAAANMQVVAAMPPGLRATNGSGATRHVIEGDKLVFAPLAQLAPKAEAKFRVQVQGLRPGDLRTKIMVTADEVREPITKEQSTHVYADQ